MWRKYKSKKAAQNGFQFLEIRSEKANSANSYIDQVYCNARCGVCSLQEQLFSFSTSLQRVIGDLTQVLQVFLNNPTPDKATTTTKNYPTAV